MDFLDTQIFEIADCQYGHKGKSFAAKRPFNKRLYSFREQKNPYDDKC